MKKLAGCLVDASIGIAVLLIAELILDPVPLTAGASWGMGLLLFWATGSRSLRWPTIGLVAGAVLGACLHLSAHATGRSTPPPEGLFLHVLADAAVGALCGALAMAASLLVHRARVRRRETAVGSDA